MSTRFSLPASVMLAIRTVEKVMDENDPLWMEEFFIGLDVVGGENFKDIPEGWPGYEPEGTDGSAKTIYLEVKMAGQRADQKMVHRFECSIVYRKNYCWEPFRVRWTNFRGETKVFWFDEQNGYLRLDRMHE